MVNTWKKTTEIQTISLHSFSTSFLLRPVWFSCNADRRSWRWRGGLWTWSRRPPQGPPPTFHSCPDEDVDDYVDIKMLTIHLVLPLLSWFWWYWWWQGWCWFWRQGRLLTWFKNGLTMVLKCGYNYADNSLGTSGREERQWWQWWPTARKESRELGRSAVQPGLIICHNHIFMLTEKNYDRKRKRENLCPACFNHKS